ncbi:hypothetical protein VTL71DRAFT_12363 [Oculimacula yallundae]|uniref:Uncharacterized protein n=1 Tax=Oculimacula yallundae TaxID=86028 RepID=A0ABR4CN48_9HELO
MTTASVLSSHPIERTEWTPVTGNDLWQAAAKVVSDKPVTLWLFLKRLTSQVNLTLVFFLAVFGAIPSGFGTAEAADLGLDFPWGMAI